MENKYNNNSIKNADTRARREWIASALESVRAHLNVSTFQTSTLESQGHEYEGHEYQSLEYQGLECQGSEYPGANAVSPHQPAARPGLYLAWSDGRRRSGT